MWRETMEKALREFSTKALGEVSAELQSRVLASAFNAAWREIHNESVTDMRNAIATLADDLKTAGQAMIDERLTEEREQRAT